LVHSLQSSFGIFVRSKFNKAKAFGTTVRFDWNSTADDIAELRKFRTQTILSRIKGNVRDVKAAVEA
jgi:hypothetical protein